MYEIINLDFSLITFYLGSQLAKNLTSHTLEENIVVVIH